MTTASCLSTKDSLKKKLPVAFLVDLAIAICYFATMTKTEAAKMIGITRQHLDYSLAGKKNFSFETARKAVVVLGGTLSLWQDRSRADDRKKVWESFQLKTRKIK